MNKIKIQTILRFCNKTAQIEVKKTFSYNFEFHLEVDVLIKKWNPLYLEASLGSKERVFEKFQIFHDFCAFLSPKRPTSKNHKKRKNRIFLKILNFYTR